MQQAIPQPRRYTVEDYLRLEEASEEKHEFRDGEIVSMAGGTLEHSLITTNIIQALGSRLRGSACRVYDSNLRVQIARKRLYSYPDVTIICGPPVVSDIAPHNYVNPTLVVEVLSPSTESYDRREKFDRFRELESFREYVLVPQDVARIETYFRHPDGAWRFDRALGLDNSIFLQSLSIALPLTEVYTGIVFRPRADLLES